MGIIDRTNLNALVDDTGLNQDGTVIDKAHLGTVFMDPIDALFGETTIASTGTQDNYNADGGASVTVTGMLRCNNASLLTLDGIVNGASGRLLWIESVGAGQVDLANQAGGSTAANRIITGVTGTISLAAGVGRALLQYDGTALRWRVLLHVQGAFITPVFAAGDYTANGSMTWTLTSGDVTTLAYYLQGRHLTVLVELVTTTVGGTVNTALQRLIPGGFTAAKEVTGGGTIISDNGGANAHGAWRVQAAATVIQFFKDLTLTANWTLATDTTKVLAKCEFEVQ